MNVEWWDKRDAGVTISTGDRGRPDRSEAGSRQPTFPGLLTEANQRFDAAAGAQRVSAPDGRRPLRTVRTGDTLSHLVQAALRQAGQRVSRGELYRAVGLVARDNRLVDPNRIRPGQPIDLSAIVPGALAQERDAGAVSDGAEFEEGSIVGGMGGALKEFLGPLAGRLTSAFGPRTHPVTGVRQIHTGVDIGLRAGSFIYPPLQGRVIFSGMTRGYGNLIVLAHTDGFTTSYGHNAANLIPVGAMVDREIPIAVVGSTGISTGPHLHFEVRRDGQPIDPVASTIKSEVLDAGAD